MELDHPTQYKNSSNKIKKLLDFKNFRIIDNIREKRTVLDLVLLSTPGYYSDVSSLKRNFFRSQSLATLALSQAPATTGEASLFCLALGV